MSDEQMDLPLSGKELRDKAMESVQKNAGRAWNHLALEVVKAVAIEHETFVCDDVHEYADRMGLMPPHDKRAWGPVMRTAVNDGICEKTGDYRPTTRPSRHAAPVAVYKSKILGWRGRR